MCYTEQNYKILKIISNFIFRFIFFLVETFFILKIRNYDKLEDVVRCIVYTQFYSYILFFLWKYVFFYDKHYKKNTS